MTSVLKVDNIQNSSGTSALSVDSSGNVSATTYVKQSAIPAFFARSSTSTYPTGSGTAAFNDVTSVGCFNQGGHYSTSTYKFTAPVDGIYSFACQLYSNNETQAVIYWYINNNAVAGTQVNGTNDQSAYEGMEMAVTFKLTANDTVHVHANTGHHLNAGYSYFCGHLVG